MRFDKAAIEAKKKLRMPIVGAVKSFDDATRTITFVASNESVDRYGDIIRVAGWDTKAYKNNPVILWAHDASQPPVGKCIDIKQDGTQLLQTVQFADAATYEFADTIYKLYKGGYLNAVSVGFIPKRYEYMFEKDKDGNPDGWPIGCEFLEQELLELSCVPVPANSEAVALMMKGLDEGMHGTELVKAMLFGVIDKALADGVILAAASDAIKAKLLAEMEVKAAEKTVAVGEGVKPITQTENPTTTADPASEAPKDKTEGADGTNTDEGTEGENSNVYIAEQFKALTDHVTKCVGDMTAKLDYTTSTEGLQAHNADMKRSVSNLHTKVDSLHAKLNGKSFEYLLPADLTDERCKEIAAALTATLEVELAKAVPVAAGKDKALVVPAAEEIPPVEKGAEGVTEPAVVPAVEPVKSAEELFLETLTSPPTTSAVAEGKTAENKLTPETQAAPEEGSASPTVKEFLDQLFGGKQ